MAVDRQGAIYVTTEFGTKRRVLKLSPGGGTWEEWGHWQGTVQPVDLWGIAVDIDGNVYAADAGNHCVQKLSPTGELLACLKADARYIAVDSQGNVYLSHGDRVQKLSPTGDLLASWGGTGDAPGRFKEPMGIAVDSADSVYVADSGNNRIQKLVVKR
jgi:DNA-binding beta-propeller fold protein YncE